MPHAAVDAGCGDRHQHLAPAGVGTPRVPVVSVSGWPYACWMTACMLVGGTSVEAISTVGSVVVTMCSSHTRGHFVWWPHDG